MPTDATEQTQTPPSAPGVRGEGRHTGKIARLPRDVRDVVNLMLQDGATYPVIVAKLKEMGHPGMTVDNISRWFTGGHETWLKEQQRLADMKAKREFALDIVRENEGSRLHEASLALAQSQIYEVLEDFDLSALKDLLKASPENYAPVVNALTKLSKGALDIDKYKDNVAEQKRKIEEELGKVKLAGSGGLAPETITKIEEALKLL